MENNNENPSRILVVDDSPDNLLILQLVITEYLPECVVVTANSANKGLTLASEEPFDAALIDVQMPEIDGIELCRKLKKDYASARIPVALLTSHSVDAATKAVGLEAGADDFINRPIDNLELIARIKVLLRIKRAEDRLREINLHLEEIVKSRTEEVQESLERHALLSRKILLAQEEERKRLSRELHDELGQILTALRLELNWLRMKYYEAEMDNGRILDKAIDISQRAIAELRHICKGLRPPLLDDLGLKPSIELLIKEFESRTQMEVNHKLDIEEEQLHISPEISLCIYRILQESLNNIYRHANADQIEVDLQSTDRELLLRVTDNGRGFDYRKTNKDNQGCGITGMQERAILVNGTISIDSQPHKGTTIQLGIPWTQLTNEEKHDQSTSS